MSWLPWLALLPLAVACDFSGPGNPIGGDAGDDGGACVAGWAAINFDPCAAGAPGGGLDLDGGSYTYDTDTGILTEPDGTSEPPSAVVDSLDPAVRIIRVASFSLAQGSELELVGSLPLIVASDSTIDIAGFIDAASFTDEGAAGAQPSACDAVAPTRGESGTGGAAGGGGGGNQAAGGAGGDGDTNGGDEVGGTGGGTLGEPATPLGGCAGAQGGDGDDTGGAGGAGGGAIQLSAKTRIDLRQTALIAASGGGGGGGRADDGGGGGGGSGGFIGLDALEVNIAANARIVANGGGGGGGAGDGAGSDGDSEADSDMAARGGSGGFANLGSTSDGGDGGTLTSTAGGSVTDQPTRAAGGGGGGVGYILIWSTNGVIDGDSIISPVALQPGR